jgi:acyl-CoA dehydrogenase
MISGTEAQQAKYLPRFCDPSKVTLGAFAITEPMAGSDAGGITTLAKRNGDKYILNGTKTFITNAGVADLYVVFVTMDPSAGTDAITAFVVEKGWPGLSFGAKEKKLGIRCSQTANVILENVEVPVENRLGEEGEGFGIAMRTFDITRTHIAAGGVGIARAAYEYALQYAQERKQFNRPIARFQAVAFMLADMATQIDAARFLVWHAAWRYDQGKKFTKEASMAKAFAGDIAAKVTTDAVQILGGYGYIREYPVEKWMRDAKIMQIYEGTAQIQRLIIARQIATES